MRIKPLHIALAALLLGACNDIAPSERLIDVPATAVKRKVLVEEFTGQRCLNCPAAAEELSRLQAHYGADTLIVVAIHGGKLALMPTGRIVGLATTQGNAYAEHWGFANALPSALINRQPAGSVKEAWAGKIRSAFEGESPLQIKLSATYDAATGMLKALTTARTSEQAVDGNLQLWLIEDDIVAPQQFPDNIIKRDYVHNHVFRATLNGEWGEHVSIAIGNEKTFSHEMKLPTDVNPAHAWVVAFVTNAGGVVQVERAKVE